MYLNDYVGLALAKEKHRDYVAEAEAARARKPRRLRTADRLRGIALRLMRIADRLSEAVEGCEEPARAGHAC